MFDTYSCVLFPARLSNTHYLQNQMIDLHNVHTVVALVLVCDIQRRFIVVKLQ